MIGRRPLLLGLASAVATPRGLGAAARGETPSALPLAMNGAWRQGGYALGRTAPRALIFVDGEALSTASADGLFIVGFDRDAAGEVEIEARDGA